MTKESNITKTKNGLTEKSTGRNIESPLDKLDKSKLSVGVQPDVMFSDLIDQPYPLIINFDLAEKIVQKIHALVRILKDGKLNENEYKLLSEITSGLRHPAPISF